MYWHIDERKPVVMSSISPLKKQPVKKNVPLINFTLMLKFFPCPVVTEQRLWPLTWKQRVDDCCSFKQFVLRLMILPRDVFMHHFSLA